MFLIVASISLCIVSAAQWSATSGSHCYHHGTLNSTECPMWNTNGSRCHLGRKHPQAIEKTSPIMARQPRTSRRQY